jgi:hypothetical protein
MILTSCTGNPGRDVQVPSVPGNGIPVTSPAPENPSETLRDLIDEEGLTVSERFLPPEGAVRTASGSGSFAAYLQSLPLKPFGEKVKYFDGREKGDRAYISVVDQDISARDLQQCADAVMRLRAEYFYSLGQHDRIAFHFVSGFLCDFKTWSSGKKVVVSGNKVSWASAPGNDSSYGSFRKYMDTVHAYASTLSLEKELVPVPMMEMQIGDVFIKGGSPGHAIIVTDMAKDEASGKTYFILAQSYMPAQETQILRNLEDPSLSPWYELKEGSLSTPEWTFGVGTLRRFP